MNRILIIQTAFIGDVILATSLLETLHKKFPDAEIDFILKKGNESLFTNHPYLKEIIVWDKKEKKVKGIFSILSKIRKKKYNLVVNLNRFGSSNLIAAFSGGREVRGFSNSFLSIFFSKKFKHVIGDGTHETERNYSLIKDLANTKIGKPKLYPSIADFGFVKQYKTTSYYCIAPTSIWFTKQLPAAKWVELIQTLPSDKTTYLLGGNSDFETCESILNSCPEPYIVNLSGKLSLLQSAALMQDAEMNYVNDSAPLHIASAMNAPVTAIFCSTIPEFGFGPLSDNSTILQTKEKLHCRPCGLHGHTMCPEGHFKCAEIQF